MSGHKNAAAPSTRASRRLLVTAMCLGSMISMFNSTMVNVMVPSIGSEFNVSAVSLEWVSAIYTLTYGALLLLGGALGAVYGRRSVFLAGIAVFTAASVACIFAPSFTVLLVARALQGAGVAMLLPQTLAILSAEFTNPAQRARVVGLWAGVASLGLAAGPVLGGLIVAAASWRVGFIVSTAFGVGAFILGARGVPGVGHGRPADPGHIDWGGAILGAIGFAALVEGLMQIPERGIDAVAVLGLFVLAAISLSGFIVWQHLRGRTGRTELMPMKLWRFPAFAAANIGGVAYFFMFFSILYFYSIDLQGARGYSPMTTGLLFLPMMLFTALFGPIAGRLAARFGTAPVLSVGLGIGCAGCLLLSFQSSAAGPLDLEWRLAIIGIASGLMSSSMSNLAVSGIDARLSSNAAAVHNTFRQIGSTLGVSVLGAIIAMQGAGASSAAHTTLPGLPPAMLVTAIIMIVSMAAVITLTHRRTTEARQIVKHAEKQATP